ncbi:MAG: sigma-E factor negative regulatory protein [Candidatus Wenzhouxiangella sp. M2_3B_020]
MNEQEHNPEPTTDDRRASETISALVDGELDPRGSEFLIRRIAEDSGMNHRWQRFHLLRACLQREFSGPVSLVERVRSAVDEEAAHESPRRPLGRMLRAGVGGAVAAGVALVAVVALDNRVGSEGLEDRAGAEAPGFVSQTTALDRQFNPAAVPAGFGGASSGDTPGAARPSQQRINRYMIRHSQAAGNNGFIALTPVLTAPSTVQVVRPPSDVEESAGTAGEE